MKQGARSSDHALSFLERSAFELLLHPLGWPGPPPQVDFLLTSADKTLAGSKKGVSDSLNAVGGVRQPCPDAWANAHSDPVGGREQLPQAACSPAHPLPDPSPNQSANSPNNCTTNK